MKNIFNTYKQFIGVSLFLFFFILLLSGYGKSVKDRPSVCYIFKNGMLKVDVYISSEELNTSELLKVNLYVNAPSNMHIILPERYAIIELPKSKLKNEILPLPKIPFSIYKMHDTAPELNSKGLLVQSRTILLEPGLPGVYMIPAMTISAVTSDNKKISIITSPFFIKVHSVLPGDNKKLDIKPIIQNLSDRSKGMALWLLLVFVGISSTAFIIIHKKNRRRVKPDREALLLYELEKLQSSQPAILIGKLDTLIFDYFLFHYNISKSITSSDKLLDLLKDLNIGNHEFQEIEDLLNNYNSLRFSKDCITPEKAYFVSTQFTDIIKNNTSTIKF